MSGKKKEKENVMSCSVVEDILKSNDVVLLFKDDSDRTSREMDSKLHNNQASLKYPLISIDKSEMDSDEGCLRLEKKFGVTEYPSIVVVKKGEGKKVKEKDVFKP